MLDFSANGCATQKPFFSVFLKYWSVSCSNLQRRAPVLGFGRKTLFHAPQGESLTGHAEKAGLSGGLGSSWEDHLSVPTLFFSFRSAWLLQEQENRLLSWLLWKAGW